MTATGQGVMMIFRGDIFIRWLVGSSPEEDCIPVEFLTNAWKQSRRRSLSKIFIFSLFLAYIPSPWKRAMAHQLSNSDSSEFHLICLLKQVGENCERRLLNKEALLISFPSPDF
jgi:hypothetical protein